MTTQEIPSEVKCKLDEVADISNRPDVERYAWDGTTVDYDTSI